MGSFRGTCHLSGMAISEDEDILLLPIVYGSVTDTSTLCYGTNKSCYPAWSPIFGKYNGYGNIENVVNKGDLFRLRKTINGSLFNHEKFATRQKEGKWLGSFYAIFDKEKHAGFEGLEFLTDAQIMTNIKERKNIHEIQSFEDDISLLEALTNNNICYINHGVSRLGNILIKKSFFDTIIQNHYQKTKDILTKNMNEFFYKVHDDDKNNDGRFTHSHAVNIDRFRSHTLCLFNDSHSISYDFFYILKLLREVLHLKTYTDKEYMDSVLEEIIENVVDFALLLHIYADIGKSFYPNTNPLKNMKCLHNFAETLKSELESVRDQNISRFKSDNGDDEDVSEFEMWQAPYPD